MATNDSTGIGIHEVWDGEGLAILDNAARYLNMSGEEFLRAWKEGRFDNGTCTDLEAPTDSGWEHRTKGFSASPRLGGSL